MTIKTAMQSAALLSLMVTGCRNNPVTTGVFPTTTPFEWTVSTPAEQGMDETLLESGFDAAEVLGHVEAIVIIKNGFLVKEAYFHGTTRETPHVVHSVSKSFLSAAAVIAISRGEIPDINTPVFDYFPQYALQTMDERKLSITVKHLMTMQAGFAGDRDTYGIVYYSKDWIGTTLGLPLIADPGTEFHYNTFETHLLSAIITEATGFSTLDYMNNVLLYDLGITCDHWQKGPGGYYFGGNNMYFTTRDMARFGQLYLDNGSIDGRQLVPEAWVNASLQYSSGGDRNWGAITEMGYGYLWWLGKIAGRRMFTALGHAGQFITVFPDLDLIIAVSSTTTPGWDDADRQERAVTEVMAQYLVPAAEPS
ncbi:serine hydrolase [bacterium]|nr:serine hydrolase [bacterium]